MVVLSWLTSKCKVIPQKVTEWPVVVFSWLTSKCKIILQKVPESPVVILSQLTSKCKVHKFHKRYQNLNWLTSKCKVHKFHKSYSRQKGCVPPPHWNTPHHHLWNHHRQKTVTPQCKYKKLENTVQWLKRPPIIVFQTTTDRKQWHLNVSTRNWRIQFGGWKSPTSLSSNPPQTENSDT